MPQLLSNEWHIYRDQIALHRAEFASVGPWMELIRDYPFWKKSLSGGNNPLRLRRPWITFGAARFLRQTLLPGDRVFEYGCGGSTLFFLDLGVHLTSTEHEPGWAQAVTASLGKEPSKRWKLHCLPPKPAPEGDEEFASTAKEYRGHTFRDYVTSIAQYPDASFRLVSVDGRARPACCAHAHTKVQPGGYLLLDNSEREIYADAFRLLESEGWPVVHFFGPGPCNGYFWRTSLWRRPAP